ncbi:ABC transporter ATP-binding protein [Candidatus Woesearchaeota archaeon]|nr:ABC transporter ATP-binding protein [Candidatus Woesearchaeota archaeon]
MPHLIQLVAIKKMFKNHAVLDNLEFSVNKGDLLGLIGKSGEGKTTFLRVLIGFYKIDAGIILFEGNDITKKTQQILKHVGFCTQDNSFYPELTIEENMIYYGRLYGIKRKALKERIEELLKLVNLHEQKDKFGSDISGGMKRRLDFAIALLHNPAILILDEPTAGLDPVMTKDIWNLIEEINQQGTTVIVSSHELDNLERKCNKIAVLNKGKIVSTTISEIKRKYKEKPLMDVFELIIKEN